MDTILARPAYAKVNLHLAVGQPFPDGYHPIRSLFALVDLFDDIAITVTGSRRFKVEVTGLEAFQLNGEDTLTKAARLWCERAHVPLSLHIDCKKRIPAQAGLGGGSSDAATVLHLLQEYASDDALDENNLADIALQVGSDVPFFLSSHCCAIVTGRGEGITPVETRNLAVCLVMPISFATSTSSAYFRLDEIRGGDFVTMGPTGDEIAEVFKKSPAVWNSLLYNDFQQGVEHQAFYSQLEQLRSACNGYSGLTGSGACWFFVSDDQRQVQIVFDEVVSRFGTEVMSWKTGLVL
ncbi:4-(cytidine 5'-diphospho)-2-C-methyl-D-erythritol kinase [Sphaerochaeta halotolerans]|jgi:4-diphosphocytidyl-2-C-methyl-D-erythritol kinase|uniref:4-diphosphocytidyl-2-C-methyl-D-erythritol kinase n=1 Tax=Sphaerochaeta halotolerans TaxID=2293840 RepID=A0A372MHT1_9SPIR|nr:4-(cytidine 5'-diphospho)-2-C-methyl-D-erythritol kinase [Sphaerochaeta halotolerans]MBG0767589.1 4-(cytidine 5'-diphospho)-2-C-methyl-D-erythritol kinase [Spirochaetaceae bacterium]MDK2859760.1 4-diphosphocytidyl-2-C-methyl-D-erythritol kinase [Sphaerochaeta sp.]MDN5334580.1 4-diphosphocytidyl-2-C-methyl-D-erythritol kinase [Sphaerochaeta sp.]MXI85702.1 4-(cytidine 5'-diphospho)-2-C-methyl-D-erythritol kinase [Sphaerochaeta halotolerans]RFU95347.1 4-(cytidine 5'-diphospho)-2-C-methyl-D-ery